MKFTLNTVLGVGGILSMVISPVLAFGGVKTDIEVLKTKMASLEQMKSTVEADHDIIIKIAAKLNVDTRESLSMINRR